MGAGKNFTMRSASSVALIALCLGAVADAATYASVRSDVWVKSLPEANTPDPKDGRRVHVAIEGCDALANVTSDKALQSVTVNGVEGINLQDIGNFDWFRAHANPELRSLWISFHTHNTGWLGSHVNVEVKQALSGPVICQGTAPIVASDAALTLSYAVMRSGGNEAVLHVHNNDDSSAHKLANLTFDGIQVANASVSIPAGGHAIFVARLPAQKHAAEVWTASLATDSGTLGFGGRADVSERLVAGVWPHSTDCSLPGGNDENAAQLRSMGVNSVFYHFDNWDENCGGEELYSVVNVLANNTSADAFHVVTDFFTAEKVKPEALKFIDALFVGDEVDGGYDSDHLMKALSRSMAAQQAAPHTLTFQGSKTTRNVGSFAGITDIQAADAYCGACAPTMLAVVLPLPVDYPYKYLRNARENHAPLPFWGYGQLYSDAWSYQPNTNEIIMQLGQAVAAGSKGIMFFQSYAKFMSQKKSVGDIGSALKSILAVGQVIHQGDVVGLGMSTSGTIGKDVLIEVIRSPEQVLVVVVNINAAGYSNLLCHTIILDGHWKINDLHLDSIDLDLSAAPDVSGLENWREAADGNLQPLSDVTVSTSGGKVQLSGIDVRSSMPLRLFVADVSR